MPPPWTGLPCGGSETKNSKKPLCPPCLGEALMRESFIQNKIFMVLVRTESIHVCFLPRKFFECILGGIIDDD
jgi:hypothetical protein